MSIKIWIDDGFDYATRITTGTMNNSQYAYGVCFTPKVNCSLTKVKFLGTGNGSTGTLYINQGDTMQLSGTSYSITTTNSAGNEYTLEIPYQLTANTNYCIGFLWNGTGTNFGINGGMVYPVDGDKVTFNYGTNSFTTTAYAVNCYGISGLYLV